MIKLLDFQVNGIYGRMGENNKVHNKEATYCTTDYLGLYPEKLVKVNLNVDQFRNIIKRRKKMNREHSGSKFKLNDKVTISDKSMLHSRFKGKVFTIEHIKKEFSFRHIYKLEGIDGAFREFELDLVPDTAIHKFETKELGEVKVQGNRIIGKLKITKNTNDDKIRGWLKLFEDEVDTGIWIYTVTRIDYFTQLIEGLEIVDEEIDRLYMIHKGALEFTFEVVRHKGLIRIENVVHNGKDVEI